MRTISRAPLIATLAVLTFPAFAQTQVWSEAPKTSNWSEAPKTSNWSEAPTTSNWSEAPKTSNWSETPTTSNWSEAPKTGNWSENFELLKPPAPTPPPQNRPAINPKVGELVEVLSIGRWETARVLEARNGQYLIHYEGLDSRWDEWVGPERMRPLTDTPAAPVTKDPSSNSWLTKDVTAPPPGGSAPTPTGQVWSTHPAGRWVCRTWDYGQVNYIAEFELKKDGNYRDIANKGSGRYRYDAKENRITFVSGPQKTSSASIHFFPTGHKGKGHIVFDYGGGAKLDCYREALP